ncbi:hypothetical protein [Derxia gummosa]|uniref:Uncharacterized protein n=1 Tax=Derxia gummosa DSM 723 TaxID=1121388 RepID=A0A8B6X6Y4_9BURK|nr:hypothetical protein [Derxia gummosa]
MTRRRWPEPFAFVAAPPRRLQWLARALLVVAVLVAAYSGWEHWRIAGMDARLLAGAGAQGLLLLLAVRSLRASRRVALPLAVGGDSLLRLAGRPMLPVARPLRFGPWAWLALRPLEGGTACPLLLEFDIESEPDRRRLLRWTNWALMIGSAGFVQDDKAMNRLKSD